MRIRIPIIYVALLAVPAVTFPAVAVGQDGQGEGESGPKKRYANAAEAILNGPPRSLDSPEQQAAVWKDVLRKREDDKKELAAAVSPAIMFGAAGLDKPTRKPVSVAAAKSIRVAKPRKSWNKPRQYPWVAYYQAAFARDAWMRANAPWAYLPGRR